MVFQGGRTFLPSRQFEEQVVVPTQAQRTHISCFQQFHALQCAAGGVAAGIKVEPVFRNQTAVGGNTHVVHVFVTPRPTQCGGDVEAADVVVEVQHYITVHDVVAAVDILETAAGVV